MAAGVELSRVGMSSRKERKMEVGLWCDVFLVVGLKRVAVIWRSWWKTAWVADSLLMDAPM